MTCVDWSDINGLIEAIKRDGCVIIMNFTTTQEVDQINSETRPWLEKDAPWKVIIIELMCR